MTASATIDTSSYLNTATDISTTKSNSSSSCDFENIFNSANKSYSKEETSNKSFNAENNRSKSEAVNTSVEKQNKATSKTENTTQEIKDEKISDDSHKKTTDATKNTEDAEKVSSSDSDTNKTETNEDVKTSEQLKEKMDEIAKAIKEKGASLLENSTEMKELIAQMQECSSKIAELAKTITDSKTVQPQPINEAINDNLSNGAQGILAALQQTTSNPEITVPEVAQTNAQELAQVAQNLKDTVANLPKTINLNTVEKTLAQNSNSAAQNEAAQLAQNKAQDAVAQTPLIQANTELVASDANLNSADTDATQNSKDITNKNISQEVIDKTNARVVSIETTGANSNNTQNNNLLNRQNAAEQIVKLSLENNSKSSEATTVNTDLTGLTNTQTDFAKTIDSVQTQAPKDLSKSDVMSQIYNKFDNLKDESTTKITIVLKPENLGKINLELVNGKDGLTAKMTTENSQVKELLDKNLNALRETLSSQGVNVDNVSVKLNEVQKQSSNDMFSFEGQTGQENQHQSNNTHNSNKNEFSLNEDSEITEETAELETTASTEKSVSVGSGAGKVDYKV